MKEDTVSDVSHANLAAGTLLRFVIKSQVRQAGNIDELQRSLSHHKRKNDVSYVDAHAQVNALVRVCINTHTHTRTRTRIRADMHTIFKPVA